MIFPGPHQIFARIDYLHFEFYVQQYSLEKIEIARRRAAATSRGAESLLQPSLEEPDLACVSAWFSGLGLVADRFRNEETGRGKTPDFRVLCASELVAYCEVKSPNDPWLDEQLAAAPSRTIVGGLRSDPVYNRLIRLTKKAEQQFTAVNLGNRMLNIMAIVNHDEVSDVDDLRHILTGYFPPDDGSRFLSTQYDPGRSFGPTGVRIDVFVWFDEPFGKPNAIVFNEINLVRRNRACELLHLDLANIRR